MYRKVLILGATGNFGKRMAKSLAKANIPIIIAARDKNKITALYEEIKKDHSEAQVEVTSFDINHNLSEHLKISNPYIAINTCGPFQNSNYQVAEACIQQSIHYIDLADGREFVNGITKLDQKAKTKNIYVISGASTVPALSSAIIDYYLKDFSTVEIIQFGITPGQKTERGLATTKSILSYLGKSLKSYPGSKEKIYGWQNIFRQNYPVLGKRWMANCDIPDLDLFPLRYKIKSIKFSAGMESGALHISMWFLSWLIRLGLPLNLPKHANFLLKLSHWFDRFGSIDGGMHLIMTGFDLNGKPHKITWFLIAKNNDGPQIPTIPAIILSKKLINNDMSGCGALPCMGLLSLDEYLNELSGFAVETYTEIPEYYKRN